MTNQVHSDSIRSERSRRFAELAIWLLVVFSAAGVGSIATSTTVDSWYMELKKPDFQPPNWLFGPVWTILYIFMGISAWLVWTNPNWGTLKKESRNFMAAFLIQLGLNSLWSILFFGQQQIGIALIEIVVLWLAIAITIRLALRINWISAWLLIPYLAWVTFATILNFALWRLN